MASDTLWNELKSKKLDMYGLQTSVEDAYDMLPLSQDSVYLKAKNPGATALVSALETAINPGNPDNHEFDMVLMEGGIITVSRKSTAKSLLKKFEASKEVPQKAEKKSA